MLSKASNFSSGTSFSTPHSIRGAHTDYAISLRVAHLQVHFIKGELWPGPVRTVPYTHQHNCKLLRAESILWVFPLTELTCPALRQASLRGRNEDVPPVEWQKLGNMLIHGLAVSENRRRGASSGAQPYMHPTHKHTNIEKKWEEGRRKQKTKCFADLSQNTPLIFH